MKLALVNHRWPLYLPDQRRAFHEDHPWWEAARLADMASFHESHFMDQYDAGLSREMGVWRLLDIGSEEGDLTALYASWGFNVAWIDPSKAWFIQTMNIFAENDLPVGPSFVGFAASTDKLDGNVVEEPRFADLTLEDEIARIRLDTFVDLTGFHPDAVSMDVEGSELAVLAGAPKLLEAGPRWWISIHGDVDPHAALPSEVHRVMRDHGYRDQFLAYDHEWHYRFWR